MKNWLSSVIRGEVGQALPIVLAMLAVGSLLIVPLLNYSSTSLNTGEIVEKKVEGLYAADAGVEDALWRLKYDPPASFPCSYNLTAVNGMSVSVIIEQPTNIFGIEITVPAEHADWLLIDKTVNYNSELGIYFYTMSITNNGEGNIKIDRIMIDLPPDLEYVDGSTGGDLTDDDDLTISGNVTVGITLDWDIPVPSPTIPEEETRYHTFQLSGPPDVDGVEGHGFVQATRDDVGTVWDVDSGYPYCITAQARDASEALVTTIKAGVWHSTEFAVACWQINP